MARAWFIVRAVVADEADRAAFDRWYADEHLPDAVSAFKARAAWRGWSLENPAVHTAFYLFGSPQEARTATGGVALKELVAAFDQAWGERVTRTRDIIEVAGEITSADRS